jgi:hypothetical protein
VSVGRGNGGWGGGGMGQGAVLAAVPSARRLEETGAEAAGLRSSCCRHAWAPQLGWHKAAALGLAVGAVAATVAGMPDVCSSQVLKDIC